MRSHRGLKYQVINADKLEGRMHSMQSHKKKGEEITAAKIIAAGSIIGAIITAAVLLLK